MFDDFVLLAYFETPLSQRDEKDPVDSILASTKSKIWQEIEKDGQEKNHEDTQQRHFYSHQPKCNRQQHQYPIRSKNKEANEAEMSAENTEFVYLRGDGEHITPVWKQFESIRRDDYREP